MKQIAYYEAFAWNPLTYNYDVWVGTATRETIRKAGFKPDLSYVMYDDEKLSVDGWACKPRH